MIRVEEQDDASTIALMAELEQFSQDVEDVTIVTLQQLAASLPSELRSQIFGTRAKTSRSHQMRDSITATVRGTNQLELGIVYYDYFQIFGVNGKNQHGAFGLPNSVLVNLNRRPNGGDVFAFRNNHPGIKPVPAVANTIINLEDLIVNELLDGIE